MAVAGQLIPGGEDTADQRGMPFGHPAQGEEGGLHAGGSEQAEDAVGVRLDAGGEPSQPAG